MPRNCEKVYFQAFSFMNHCAYPTQLICFQFRPILRCLMNKFCPFLKEILNHSGYLPRERKLWKDCLMEKRALYKQLIGKFILLTLLLYFTLRS